MNTATTTQTTMMMNPATGSVASLEEWRADFASMSPEEIEVVWGGLDFEDADLIEVVLDEDSKTWIEAE